ncbi:hypothetical protein Nepgr_015819 [Nepenthes gracilis]|uniref:Uncharacterized protein n=1 Tax=Nepenthes gracilis TaxID=150966 RepID=A0AAD3XR21_NEPGR|nr:hypothetical protein Nepgr_015819 [Nepenthes gracilis]
MDEEDFPDPTLIALKMLLEANVTQTYLDALTPESRQIMSDFLENYLLSETVETGAEFTSSSPLAERWLDRRVDDVPSIHALDEADQITPPPSEQDGHWKQAKSWRCHKFTSKQKGSWPVNLIDRHLVSLVWCLVKELLVCWEGYLERMELGWVAFARISSIVWYSAHLRVSTSIFKGSHSARIDQFIAVIEMASGSECCLSMVFSLAGMRLDMPGWDADLAFCSLKF